MTPEADEFLAELVRKSGFSEGKVLALALAMLGRAIDARQQGKHVGVATDPAGLDVELTGF